jgi:(p)ppGpp synthase/HD superfamily hydrolase
MLTDRFAHACALAVALHAQQLRKGTRIPYVSHLLAVASLVLEHGGDEDQAIAGLLHDAVEDQGGLPTLRQIRETFGPRVAALVMGCTDAAPAPGQAKLGWRARKAAFLQRLRCAAPEVALIVACDKLHNLRCLVADLEREGPTTLARFSHPAELGWYFAGVIEALDSQQDRLPLAELTYLQHRLRTLVRGVELPTGSADV